MARLARVVPLAVFIQREADSLDSTKTKVIMLRVKLKLLNLKLSWDKSVLQK